MSRDGSVDADWGDGTYRFRIGIGQAVELEEKADCGCQLIYQRLQLGDNRVAYVRETIRVGLIGGGIDPIKALNLVRTYYDPFPISLHHKKTALIILGAGLLIDPSGEKPGKRGAARATKRQSNSQTDEPPLPPTTGQEQS